MVTSYGHLNFRVIMFFISVAAPSLSDGDGSGVDGGMLSQSVRACDDDGGDANSCDELLTRAMNFTPWSPIPGARVIPRSLGCRGGTG